MPNHITTVVTVTGDDAAIDALVAKHIVKVTKDRREGEDRFDLETVIPMPQCVFDTSCDVLDQPAGEPKRPGDALVEWYAQILISEAPKYRPAPAGYTWLPASVRTLADLKVWIDANHPGTEFWARRLLRCAAETGHPGWYSWSVANWGTKWNAYDYEQRERADGRFVFAFDTAWAPPTPVLRKLSEMHPTLHFAIESIDEGGPEYAGEFKAGVGDLPRMEEDRERYRRVMQREPYSDDEDDTGEEPATAEAN